MDSVCFPARDVSPNRFEHCLRELRVYATAPGDIIVKVTFWKRGSFVRALYTTVVDPS